MQYSVWRTFILFTYLQSLLFQCCLSDCTLSKVTDSLNNEFICQHGNLTEVPRNNIRSETLKLDLSHNSIEILHEDVFRHLGKLRILNLENNKLWKVTELAFGDLRDLESLSLENNNLVIQNNGLSPSAFTYLPRLKSLNLSRNPLGRLPGNLFSKLRSLKALYIDNAVYGLKIEREAFNGLGKLEILSLTNNQLVTLSSDIQPSFETMNLNKLLLDGNSWNCDCKLKWLRRWFQLKNQSIFIETRRISSFKTFEPKCWNPISRKPLSPINMFTMPISAFECEPKIFSKPTYKEVKELGNVTFSCLFYSDPKSYVKWYKDGTLIQTHWERMTQKVQQGNTFYANLTILSIRRIDDGVYRCETGNGRGSVSANHTLIVKSLHTNSLKLDKVVILVGIGALGLIILLAAIGIIVYCFYGRDSFKPLPSANGTVMQSNTFKQQQIPLLTGGAGSPRNQMHMLEGVPDMHVDDYLGHLEINKQLSAIKRLCANSALESMNTSSGSNSLLRHESVPLNAQIALDQNDLQRSNSGNDDCPVHGPNRSNSNTCPVHGHNSEGSNAEDHMFHHPFSSYNDTNSGCPVHATETSSSSTISNSQNNNKLKNKLPEQPSLLRMQSPTHTNEDQAFIRASKVDDCLIPNHSYGASGINFQQDPLTLFLPTTLNSVPDGSLNFLNSTSKRTNDPDTIV